MRRTVASLSPWALAIVRVLQFVAFGGFLCSAASTITATWERVIRGIRPGRGASFSSPALRSARSRCHHSCMVGREMRKCTAIAWLILYPLGSHQNNLGPLYQTLRPAPGIRPKLQGARPSGVSYL
jgi:hypothetical protein